MSPARIALPAERKQSPEKGEMYRVPKPGRRYSGRPSHAPRFLALRWLLLLLFAAGYLGTRQVFRFYAGEYIVLSLVSVGACALLLTRLNAPVRATFPIWILLLIFCVGYYLQFFILAMDPDVYTGLILAAGEASEPVLMDAYRTTTLAFLAMCLTGWLLLRMKHLQPKATGAQSPAVRIPIRSGRFACALLLAGIVILELITGYVSWTTGMAVMGAETVTLPYRLAGAVFYTRFVILPGLLLLLIWLADRFKLQGWFRACIGLLIVHAAADAVLRTSRATLVFALLGLVFVFTLSQGMNRKRLRWIAVGFAVSVLLFPVLSVYRNLRIGNPSEIAAPLKGGFRYTYGSENLGDTLSDTFYAFVFRVTGMGSLLKIAGSGSNPLGYAHASQVTIFFNQDILRIPTGVMNSVAPSLVGWFYLVGGDMAVLFGIAAFVALSQVIWGFLGSSSLLSKLVGQALFLTFLVPVAADGVLEGLLWTILGVVLAIGAAELLLRSAGVRNVTVARGEVSASRVPSF